MKLAFTLLLSSAAIGFGQPAQPKPLTPGMCLVKQPAPVTIAYIHYCMEVSEHKVPACPAVAAPKGKEVYFEPLDCSWHSGKNPRAPKVMVK